MDRLSLKRMRSEESLYTLQTKRHINDKIMNSHDVGQLKKIHGEKRSPLADKTTKLLFQAARLGSNNNIEDNRKKKIPLHHLVILYGNGQIETAKKAEQDDVDEFLWVRRKAKCCARNTYVQSNCINCQNHLCEECGYSCTECGQFICNSCITVFGHGDAEKPFCEKCSLYI